MHIVTFLHIELHDAAGQLTRHASGLAVGLALNGLFTGLQGKNAGYCHTCYHQHKNGNGKQQEAFLLLHNGLLVSQFLSFLLKDFFRSHVFSFHIA